MIRSVLYDQQEILKAINELHMKEWYEVDITYGNGSFWKGLERPEYCLDIEPLKSHVIESSSINLPFKENSIKSIVFDPPFLTYVKSAREHNSIMAKRFGGYWRYDELELHYKSTLREVYRVLEKKGIMVFKCQDIIHNHKMHSTHINTVNWAGEIGLRLKDMFVLPAKNRIPMPEKEGEKKRVQKHARIFHSYFLVFEKGAKK